MRTIILLPLLAILTGCALLSKIAPGQDSLIIRCEQTETIAKATFDLAVNVDNANRAFFASNAAPYHAFCEWLRQPTVVNGTNVLPRGLAFVLSLDTVKTQYKSGRANSNAVVTAISVLETALIQAQNFISQQQSITKTNVVIP